MNIKRKVLWASFFLTQATGAILAIVLPQSHPPHYLLPLVVIAFPLAAICLMPGIFVAGSLVDALHLPATDPSIVATAVILNGIVWYVLRMVVRRIPNE
jgi:hypothetical protein